MGLECLLDFTWLYAAVCTGDGLGVEVLAVVKATHKIPAALIIIVTISHAECAEIVYTI